MRDPKRLNEFYDKFKSYHMVYCPDLRFGQFIHAFFGWAYDKYGLDMFYPEDNETLGYLREFINEKFKNKENK